MHGLDDHIGADEDPLAEVHPPPAVQTQPEIASPRKEQSSHLEKPDLDRAQSLHVRLSGARLALGQLHPQQCLQLAEGGRDPQPLQLLVIEANGKALLNFEDDVDVRERIPSGDLGVGGAGHKPSTRHPEQLLHYLDQRRVQCSEIAATYRQLGQRDAAYSWLRQAACDAETFLQWQAAALIFRDMRREAAPRARRTARVAVLGSYTTSQLALLLGLAAFREGADVEIYESRYEQYSQDLIDSDSELHAFHPEVVIFAVHEGALRLPELSDDPDAAIGAELERWRALWALARERAT